jgi:general secretion pathway protein H
MSGGLGSVILPRAVGEGDHAKHGGGGGDRRALRSAPSTAFGGPPPPLCGGGLGRDERGFSLLELIVVLAIMALAAVALVPITGSASRGITIDAAARAVAVELRAARSAAIYANRETDFTIDAAARRYWSDAAPRQQALPDGITAAVAPGERSRGSIRFYPDGSASGGAILLTGPQRTARIEVDALTGRARIDVGR